MVCANCEHAIHPIPLDSMTTCPGRTGCPACFEASKLENQVVKATTRLKNLLRKLAAQRQTVNYAHSPIIHKMPVEVMSRIFTFVVHPRIAFRREELQHHTVSVPMRLGQVCKAWRLVAWSTPSIWTHLTVALELSYTPTRVQLVYEFLSRARTYGLVLSIYTQAYDFLPDDVDMYKTLLKQIAVFVPHCFVLSMDMPEPLMRYLWSKIEGVHNVFTLNAFSSGDRPSNSLTITHTDDRWKSLTELTLECVTVIQCVKFLQSAPWLQTCVFLKVVWEDDTAIATLRVTTHERLTSLTVHLMREDPVPAHDPFSYLILPRLRYLEYSIITPQSQTSWRSGFARPRDDQFLAFLRQSACPLEVLKLKGFGWDDDFMMLVFHMVPSVVHLGILSRFEAGRRGSALDRLVSHLSLTATHPRDSYRFPPGFLTLPNLQHLKIYSEPSSSHCIIWPFIPDCFGPASEFQDNSPDYRRLRSLVVTGHPKEYEEKDYYIDKNTLLELIKLRDAGAHISYWCFDGANQGRDYFAASMEFHGIEEEESSGSDSDSEEALEVDGN